jgi:hypothetical protein
LCVSSPPSVCLFTEMTILIYLNRALLYFIIFANRTRRSICITQTDFFFVAPIIFIALACLALIRKKTESSHRLSCFLYFIFQSIELFRLKIPLIAQQPAAPFMYQLNSQFIIKTRHQCCQIINEAIY